MKVLVTGGASFVGNHVAQAVRKAGHEVTVFDQVQLEGLPSIRGNLLDAGGVRTAAKGNGRHLSSGRHW